jgi:hypothetical protein
MSTLKADAVTSAQDNTALTLSGTGTGGVKVNDFLVQTKGSDIASDTALTLGKDANLFDVTGTTTITSIATQGIGSVVTLHFDGVLTFTHHSTNLILPGAANITTAAGDIAVMYEYASADWRCVSYTKASGAAVVAAGGGFTLGTEQATTSGSSVTFTGIPSGTTQINLMLNHVSGNGTGTYTVTIGDSGGLETSGYEGGASTVDAGHTVGANSAAFIVLRTSSAAQFFNGVVSFYLEDSSANTWSIYGIIGDEPGGNDVCSGSKSLSGELTQLSFIMADTMDAGAVNISYQ